MTLAFRAIVHHNPSMSLGTWDEIRTAFNVARLGTVSGAADALGVHHATVIRHIDSLEARLGVKLFQRHARGYSATEAGRDLLQVAQATDDQFSQLVNRIRGQGDAVSGELVVTSLPALSKRITELLVRFRERHPEVLVRYITGEKLLRLEYGEAHVAIRAGRKPQNPDNVVQPFLAKEVALYASEGYIQRRGRPASDDDLAGHDFVAQDNLSSNAPFLRWLVTTVPPERIVFRASDFGPMIEAIRLGVGMGFLSGWEAGDVPGLVQVIPPRPEWTSPSWIVTHVDLHRTTKVQAFLAFLKEEAKEW
ncbi:LysR family transcriptional regulator [Silicimonas algicola]|uniref:LysR family transcriptional regulator n=2 Tax=Silicimonas algicola TaxID=1826607 RepID=A0A316GFZ0_9RHOB|nr:LysR family transcriptional regulator [Silicimonas algicola]